MSTTTYTLQLARSANGNWSLTPSDNLTDQLPPMAFPASMERAEAKNYAAGMLTTARVLAPEPEQLAWHVIGWTELTTGARVPAYRASWSVTVSSLSPAL